MNTAVVIPEFEMTSRNFPTPHWYNNTKEYFSNKRSKKVVNKIGAPEE
jgi:hypothetical protein